MEDKSLKEIREIVVGGLNSLKICLYDDDECYWPQEGQNNGPTERNLSMHVGHMFLKCGWLVFAEASYPKQTGRRLDLLALRSGTLVAGECKQLDLADRAKAFADDAKDMSEFRLTTSWDTREWKAPTIDKRYGLLLATTWNQEIMEWWRRKNDHRALPENLTSEDWRNLGKRLDEVDAVYGEQWLDMENGKPDFWALYAIFRLQG